MRILIDPDGIFIMCFALCVVPGNGYGAFFHTSMAITLKSCEMVVVTCFFYAEETVIPYSRFP